MKVKVKAGASRCLGQSTGLGWVWWSHTAPAPADTAPIPGTGLDDPQRPRVLIKPGGSTNTMGYGAVEGLTRLLLLIENDNDDEFVGHWATHQNIGVVTELRVRGSESEPDVLSRSMKRPDESLASSHLVLSPCHSSRRAPYSSQVLSHPPSSMRQATSRLRHPPTSSSLSQCRCRDECTPSPNIQMRQA